MCLCVVCLVLLFLHSCPGYFLSYQCINTFVDVPDLSPISTKTTNFCSGVLPSFYSVLEFPLLLSSLFFAPCVGNETNLWNLSNFMDTFGMLPLCHQNSQRTILGFYLFFFLLWVTAFMPIPTITLVLPWWKISTCRGGQLLWGLLPLCQLMTI